MGYLDSSGLYIKIGPETAVPQVGGEYKTYAELREIELTLTLSATSVLTTAAIVADTIFFPAGVKVQEAEVYVVTAPAGATGTLNVGLIGTDRTTSIDPQAFLKAAPVGAMLVAQTTKYTSATTGAGNYILNGTVGTVPALLTWDWDTVALTAGVIKVRIRYLRA